MKRIIKSSEISAMIVVFIILSMPSSFAAEVNSIPANVGDTVTYEIRVNPCPNKIQALDVVIYYDSSSLEYVPYSLELPNISGFMTNTNIDGEIRYNAMDFEGFSFNEDKILSNVQFTVKDTTTQNLNLTYEIKAFIDSTTTDLQNTYVYDVTSVNGGVERINQNDTSSASIADSDIFNIAESTETDTVSSEISTDSEAIADSDSDITEILTDLETDTNIDTESEIVDNFEEFLTQAPVPSEKPYESSTVSSQTAVTNNQNNTKLYLLSTAVAVAAVLIIGIIFGIAAKRSNNGSHFSKR